MRDLQLQFEMPASPDTPDGPLRPLDAGIRNNYTLLNRKLLSLSGNNLPLSQFLFDLCTHAHLCAGFSDRTEVPRFDYLDRVGGGASSKTRALRPLELVSVFRGGFSKLNQRPLDYGKNFSISCRRCRMTGHKKTAILSVLIVVNVLVRKS
jgi:hypothetical protein